MRYIETLREGDRISEVYLCRQKQTFLTKAGKPYDSLMLQDKTGTLDAKIWDVNSGGIEEFDSLDYVYVMGDVTSFQGKLQLNVKRVKRVQADSVNAVDYLPVSEHDIPQMYRELTAYIAQFKNPWLKKLAESFFLDADFAERFQFHSAAKSVHHGFVGGLVEHTLHVTQICEYFCKLYPMMNRDLLLAAAMFHDIGKLKELSKFPANDYTDDGQLLGH
ncbi:MAG: HDIG domain-containing protein, partial [Lachnospiraceae bacterium]|nr:HDIG domain-containing protein [Lachnospiraceae bacterium]